MAYDTAATIINDAAVEAGLAAVTDPFASTDPNFVQLCRLLKSTGRELVREHLWNHLRKTATFATVTGTSTYALPADYWGMVDQSGWNRTTDIPLGGPISPQVWEYLVAAAASTTITIRFRIGDGVIEVCPGSTVPNAETIAYEYRSNLWVKPCQTAWAGNTAYVVGDARVNSTKSYRCITAGTSAASGGPTTTSADITDGTVHWRYEGASATYLYDYPSYDDDVCCLDAWLLGRALKLAFLKAKGFDTASAQADYERAFALVSGDDTPSPILRLGGSRTGVKLMDETNIPDSGYGA